MKDLRINLLDKSEKKITDKLLYFGLHYFRYIIVITQIAVISVFFFRFYIDQQIIDYKEAFSQKQQILSITFPLVVEARELQNKTKNAREIISRQEKELGLIDYIFDNIPSDVTLSSLDWGEKIEMKGLAATSVSVAAMQKRFAESGKFKQVQVEDVTRTLDGQFDFALVIDK